MEGLFLFLGDIGGTELILLLLVIPVGFLIHFLPSILARNRPDFWIIFLINLLAGWSIVGWVVALVLSLRSKALTSSGPSQPNLIADELAKLNNLRTNGLLTDAEFEQQKQSLLR